MFRVDWANRALSEIDPIQIRAQEKEAAEYRIYLRASIGDAARLAAISPVITRFAVRVLLGFYPNSRLIG
jgi:hypothetical protein